MTNWIRYFRLGRPEDAGLIIVGKTEIAAHKARLEAAGYVVVDNPLAPFLPVTAGKPN